MITHLLFDHDGVLVDTERWYFEATREALAMLDLNMTFDDYKQHLVDGTSSWKGATALGATDSEISETRTWRDARYQHYLQTENIDIEGVAEVLEELSKTYKMAVVTTSKRADYELIHRDRTLLNKMAFSLCREDYISPKPAAEPYKTGLTRFGVSADSAIVIEDSKRGLLAAQAAGIRAVKVHNEFVAHQNANADYTIPSLGELPLLLKSLDGQQ